MESESFNFELASLSDTGRVRSLNEDAVAVDCEFGFAVVADGMGGHRSGDVASRMALDFVTERLRKRSISPTLSPSSKKFAETVVAEANSAIHAAASNQAECKGMGTTLAMLFFFDRRATLAHVGDSRIYRLRNSQLELLTRDDSLLHDQVELGFIAVEDVGDSHNRHLVTQALGISPKVTVHVRETDLRSGDVFLLCTDGLNDLVDDRDIEVIVDALKTNLPLAASHLVQLANDNGGFDNITVALVRVQSEVPVAKKKTWFSRMFGWLVR